MRSQRRVKITEVTTTTVLRITHSSECRCTSCNSSEDPSTGAGETAANVKEYKVSWNDPRNVTEKIHYEIDQK
jgi:hypothetical protein